jgi:hypothetical protein
MNMAGIARVIARVSPRDAAGRRGSQPRSAARVAPHREALV